MYCSDLESSNWNDHLSKWMFRVPGLIIRQFEVHFSPYQSMVIISSTQIQCDLGTLLKTLVFFIVGTSSDVILYEGNLSLTFTKCTVKQCLGKTQNVVIRSENPPRMPKPLTFFRNLHGQFAYRYTPSYHVPTSARFDDFCYFTWMAESLWYQLVVGKHPGLISHGWPSVKTRVSWRRGRIQESVWGRWPWSLALLRMGILDKNRMEKRGRRNVGGVDFVCVAHKESEGKP